MGRYDAYINSEAWRRKRVMAFAVYGRHCSRCPATTKLHVHHKTYARFGDELIEDLQILCEACHMKEHNRGRKKKQRRQRKNEITTTRKSKVSKQANRRNRRYEKSTRLKPDNAAWLAEVRAKLGRT